MYIKVDTALCERSGICTELAPDTFRLEEEGLVVMQDAPDSDVDDVRFAAENCPRLALSVQD